MSEEKEIRLPDTSKLVVSSSPHYHAPENVSHIMLIVILALVPACISGVIFFGLPAVKVLALSAFGCMGAEYIFSKMMDREPTLGDHSALLTGILLGMNLSASTPWWVCLIGAFLAIGLGKMIYGGLGYNPFNPALVGRVALFIALPAALTTWVTPEAGRMKYDVVDSIAQATPLGHLANITDPSVFQPASYLDCFLGNIGGCIGETSALALLIGGIFLIIRGIIRWQVPVFFIATVFVITGVTWLVKPQGMVVATPLFHTLTGGLMLGAFFMATDMVTSPMTNKGCIIFGVGCGLITSVIRLWGVYPEGVSFSILFMNALTPLIDQYTGGKPFGARQKEKKQD